MRSLLLLAYLAPLSCNRHDAIKAVPLEIIGAPPCPAGETYDPPVALRLEQGSRFSQEALHLAGPHDPIHIMDDWPTEGVTVKVGTCHPTQTGADCTAPAWLVVDKATLKKTAGGYELSLPKVSLRCSGGSTVTNGS